MDLGYYFFLTTCILILDFSDRFSELPTWALGGNLVSTQSPSLPAFCSIHSICSFLAFPKKNAARKPNKQFSPENWGGCKIHWCPTKMKHSTVLLGGNPHHSCVPFIVVETSIMQGFETRALRTPSSTYGLAIQRSSASPRQWHEGNLVFFTLSRLSRESSTCVSVCVYWCFTQKISHHTDLNFHKSKSNRSNKCRHSSLQLSQSRISF